MPQFDPHKGKMMEAEEILNAIKNAYKWRKWREVEHYATLLALEAAEKQPVT